MTHHDLAEVVDAIEKIAAVDPDHTYSRPDWDGWDPTIKPCSYVHHFNSEGEYIIPSSGAGVDMNWVARSEPGCIIGQYLVNVLNMDPKWFNESVDRGVSVRDLLRVLPFHEFSEDARTFMTRVQDRQDRGLPWGVAVSEGKSIFTL